MTPGIPGDCESRIGFLTGLGNANCACREQQAAQAGDGQKLEQIKAASHDGGVSFSGTE